MGRPDRTVTDESAVATGGQGDPVPGLALVYSNGTPLLRAESLPPGGLELGRASFDGRPLEDDRISGTHARLSFDGERWSVEDLGSRNGTWVNAEKITARVTLNDAGVLRIGRSLFLMLRDARPFLSDVTRGRPLFQRRGAAILGPAMIAA